MSATLAQRFAELKALGRAPAHAGRNLGAIALEAARAEPDRVLVIEAARRITRGQMLGMALRLGGGLIAKGLHPGETLAFQLPNWWEAAVVNLAAALFGWRLVPLLPIYRAAELGVILPACGVRAIFIPETFRNTDYPALIASLPAAPEMVFTVRGGGAERFEALLDAAPGMPAPAVADEAKVILFTSRPGRR